jgi:hypothetical protein
VNGGLRQKQTFRLARVLHFGMNKTCRLLTSRFWRSWLIAVMGRDDSATSAPDPKAVTWALLLTARLAPVVHIPTSDGRELILPRHTEPEPELQQLKLTLPPQPLSRITGSAAFRNSSVV